MKYLLLTDEENKDVVVKADERYHYEPVFGMKESWQYKGMLPYFNEGSPRFGKYEEITEEQALRLIETQDKVLNSILDALICKLDRDNFKPILEKDIDKEQKVVYLLFLLGKGYLDSYSYITDKLPRLNNSVDCLFNHIDRLNESDLIELRVHRNTRLIALDYYERQFINKRLSEEQYHIVRDFLFQRIERLDDAMAQILSNNVMNLWVNIRNNVLGGTKVPHSTSQPVIRKEGNNYYMAVFTFFYNREDIESGMVSRPTIWTLADLKTGEVIREYSTKEKDFSDASYDIKYNVRADKKYDNSREYYDETFAVLDSVRNKILDVGEFDFKGYKNYLDRILINTPIEYQRFFTDLSI